MKFLLTSAGVSNLSIRSALVDLLGKPIEESSALCIPSGINPFPGGMQAAYRFITGTTTNPLVDLDWKSMGVMELAVLPTIDRAIWVDAVQESDALLFQGGDVVYLSHWLRESGLAALIPELTHELVWVGVSAGSMVTAAHFGETLNDAATPFISVEGLGLVDFALLPHMDHPDHPESTREKIATMARAIGVPTYGIDDQTAIKVDAGSVEVVSEGNWELFGG